MPDTLTPLFGIQAGGAMLVFGAYWLLRNASSALADLRVALPRFFQHRWFNKELEHGPLAGLSEAAIAFAWPMNVGFQLILGSFLGSGASWYTPTLLLLLGIGGIALMAYVVTRVWHEDPGFAKARNGAH